MNALIPRRQVDAALERTAAKMLKDAERSLRIAHLYGDLREALALVAGCALVRGDLQIEALKPLPRMLGGIHTELLIAVQPRSPQMQNFVKNEVGTIVTHYIRAISSVINGREGADEHLLELVANRDEHMKKLAALRETVRPGPKPNVADKQVKELTCVLILGRVQAGMEQKTAILSLHDELQAKENPDSLELAVLARLNKSADPVKLVTKWLESRRKIDFSPVKALT